jgi:hypothetical protein
MATFIKDLERFKKDCKYYEEVINSIENEKVQQSFKSMYADFLIKVEAVDRSVEDMAGGFVAVGGQHSQFVDDLKETRLRLDREIKKLKRSKV